nr:RecName: Full=Toxin AnmTx Cj 1c-1; Flags: Precursor [Epiactis japonica]
MLNKRGVPCRCESDGPPRQNNALSGTTFYVVGCNKAGWNKCRYINAISTCCKEG